MSGLIAEVIQRVCLGQVCLFEEIDSTNEYLLTHGKNLPTGSVCLAERQTAGRGRRGRTWHSPTSQNLYFSLLWRYHSLRHDLSALSLVVALTIANTLAAQSIPDIQLKWPNDIYYRGKKIGGILIESRQEPSGIALVIGIGLNLGMTAEENAINQAWADLAEFQLDRTACVTQLIAALQAALAEFAQTGFAPFVKQWLKWDYLRGQAVRLLQENATLYGVAQGVNERGELLLAQDGKLQAFAMGELSVRLDDGILA